MSAMRREVLSAFRNIHRTCECVFGEDTKTLKKAKTRINSEYKKYIKESSQEIIEKRIKFSRQVEEELRQGVIQAEEIRPGVYRAFITDDTYKTGPECAKKDRRLTLPTVRMWRESNI